MTDFDRRQAENSRKRALDYLNAGDPVETWEAQVLGLIYVGDQLGRLGDLIENGFRLQGIMSNQNFTLKPFEPEPERPLEGSCPTCGAARVGTNPNCMNCSEALRFHGRA